MFIRKCLVSSFSALKEVAGRTLPFVVLILLAGQVSACNSSKANSETEPLSRQELESRNTVDSADLAVEPISGPAETSQTVQVDEVVKAPETKMAMSEVGALVIWTTPVQVQPIMELGREFEQTYGIPVHVESHELSSMLDDFRLSLSLQAAMPDIFLGGHDWVSLLAANGVISPLNLDNHKNEFAPSVMRSMSYGGEQFGVPVKAESLALVVNTELVSEPPVTWDQVKELAAVHVQSTGAAAGLGLNVLSPFDFYPVLTGFGGDLFRYTPDTGFEVEEVRLDSESSLRALAWLSEMRAQGLINLELSPGEMLQAFIDQELPLLITGSWSLPALEAANVEFIVTEFPEGGRPFVNVQGYMVNAYAPDPFLAWLFLSTLLISENGMEGILTADPAVPAFLPLLGHDLSPRMKEFSQVANYGAEVPNVLQMAEVWRIWGQNHYEVLKNGADGTASYRTAAEGIKALFDGN